MSQHPEELGWSKCPPTPTAARGKDGGIYEKDCGCGIDWSFTWRKVEAYANANHLRKSPEL
jgi:hypothetical protein